MNWNWPLSSRFPGATVHRDAVIGEGVTIGPYSVIGPNVKMGVNNIIHNNVTILGNTTIGDENQFHPGSVIGTEPQDLKYGGEDTQVIVGSGNTLRECVTVHKGTVGGGGVTRIGDQNLIMACCHIAHDCEIGSRIIMGNSVLLGGHVQVDDQAHFGGLAAIHHFTTIGRLAFIGGMTRITKDVPPFMLVEGNPSRVWGVNKVGCERRGLDKETIEALHQAFKKLFREGSAQQGAIQEIRSTEVMIPELDELLTFIESSESGPKGRVREKNR